MYRFKLHLCGKTLASSHAPDQDIPSLPKNKTAVGVFADFMRYLFRCARTYIEETHTGGHDLWQSFDGHIDFLLSHPNGWDGVQQHHMRQAAVLAALIPDNQGGQDRLQFVSEGEACLHFCFRNGLSKDAMKVRAISLVVNVL